MAVYYPPFPMEWFDGAVYAKEALGPAAVRGVDLIPLFEWARARPGRCVRNAFLERLGYDPDTLRAQETRVRKAVIGRAYALFEVANARPLLDVGRQGQPARWFPRSYSVPEPAVAEEHVAFYQGRVLVDDGVERTVAGFSPDHLRLRFTDTKTYSMEEVRARWRSGALRIRPMPAEKLNAAVTAILAHPMTVSVFASHRRLWGPNCSVYGGVTIAANGVDVMTAPIAKATHLGVGARARFLVPRERIEALALLDEVGVERTLIESQGPFMPARHNANAPPGYETYLDYFLAVRTFSVEAARSHTLREVAGQLQEKFGPQFYMPTGIERPWLLALRDYIVQIALPAKSVPARLVCLR